MVKCREHHVADGAVGEQLAQTHRERLVVIVFADEHDAPRAIASLDDGLVILQPEKRRLLDEHVLAGGERLQRQIEVPSRRHGDDHDVDLGIGDRGVVGRVARHSAVTAAELGGLGGVAAGVGAARCRLRKRTQLAAVDLCDEPAPEKRDTQRHWHFRRAHHNANDDVRGDRNVDRVLTGVDRRALRATMRRSFRRHEVETRPRGVGHFRGYSMTRRILLALRRLRRDTWVHRHRHHVAGVRHRPQHPDLQFHEPRAAQGPAVP